MPSSAAEARRARRRRVSRVPSTRARRRRPSRRLARDLAEPPLEPPALGLERERLRVALGERRPPACASAAPRRVEELFDLCKHGRRPVPRSGIDYRQARRSGMGRAAHLPCAEDPAGRRCHGCDTRARARPCRRRRAPRRARPARRSRGVARERARARAARAARQPRRDGRGRRSTSTTGADGLLAQRDRCRSCRRRTRSSPSPTRR